MVEPECGARGQRSGEVSALGGEKGHYSVTRRAASAIVWIVAGTGAGHLIRLVRNLVLTRLLFPEAFGLMAIVGIFNQGLQMFSDVGILPSIIHNERGDEEAFLNTAWTVQVIRGGLLWLCGCLLAWPVAWAYDEPMLGYLIPVAALASLASGFNSTKFATAHRHIKLGRVKSIGLAASVATTVVAIAWAWAFRSIWALVAGSLAGALARMALSHVAIPGGTNRLHWDPSAWRALLSFGKWIFLSTLLTFLIDQGDRIVLGKLISMETLGVYSIAFMIYQAPRQQLQQLGRNIIFPAVARRSDLPREELRSRLARQRRKVLLLAGPGILLLAVLGDQLILLGWDPRYAGAAWMLAILALGLWPSLLLFTSVHALVGVGHPQYRTYANLARLIFLLAAFPVGFYLFGLPGLIGAVAAHPALAYAVVAFGLHRQRLWHWRDDALATVAFAALLAAGLAVRMALGGGLPYGTPAPLIG